MHCSCHSLAHTIMPSGVHQVIFWARLNSADCWWYFAGPQDITFLLDGTTAPPNRGIAVLEPFPWLRPLLLTGASHDVCLNNMRLVLLFKFPYFSLFALVTRSLSQIMYESVTQCMCLNLKPLSTPDWPCLSICSSTGSASHLEVSYDKPMFSSYVTQLLIWAWCCTESGRSGYVASYWWEDSIDPGCLEVGRSFSKPHWKSKMNMLSEMIFDDFHRLVLERLNSQLCCVEGEEERGWNMSIDHKTKTKKRRQTIMKCHCFYVNHYNDVTWSLDVQNEL